MEWLMLKFEIACLIFLLILGMIFGSASGLARTVDSKKKLALLILLSAGMILFNFLSFWSYIGALKVQITGIKLNEPGEVERYMASVYSQWNGIYKIIGDSIRYTMFALVFLWVWIMASLWSSGRLWEIRTEAAKKKHMTAA